MKNKIFIIATVMAVLGLAAAVYALNGGSAVTDVAAKTSCCKKDGADSCPMKAKEKKEHKSEHASMSCCGDSCMMKKGEGTMSAHDGKACCDCCGDSCPLKAKGNAATAVKASDSEAGECCCSGGNCCCTAKNKETEA